MVDTKKGSVTYGIAVVGVFFILTLILAYGLNLPDPLTLTLQKFYPALTTTSQYTSIYDVHEYLEITKKLNPSLPMDAANEQATISLKKRQLTSMLNLNITQKQIDNELKFETTGKSEEYRNLLNNYFNGNEKLYKKYVVIAQTVDAFLRINYNSDITKNRESFARAQSILDRIKQGEKFETLVGESDDLVSSQFGGDLGFVSSGQILPELENSVAHAKIGEVVPEVVVSRAGFHIIFPLEISEQNGLKLWHVKHILVETTGYDEWLNDQLVKIKVWKIKG